MRPKAVGKSASAKERRAILKPHLERRRAYLRAHPGTAEGVAFGIESGLLTTGMTAAEAEASWGSPAETAEEVVGGVAVQVWRYPWRAKRWEDGAVLIAQPWAAAAEPVRVRLVEGKVVDADGLGTRYSERAAYVRAHPDALTPEHQRAILHGSVWLGASAEQARAALGEPDDVNRSVSRAGVREQWVYARGSGDTLYVYLDDGVVTSWQE